MAKLVLTRFPDAPEEYERQQQSELIRQLEALIEQLNTQYTLETQEEATRRAVFLNG